MAETFEPVEGAGPRMQDIVDHLKAGKSYSVWDGRRWQRGSLTAKQWAIERRRYDDDDPPLSSAWRLDP